MDELIITKERTDEFRNYNRTPSAYGKHETCDIKNALP